MKTKPKPRKYTDEMRMVLIDYIKHGDTDAVVIAHRVGMSVRQVQAAGRALQLDLRRG